MVVVSPDVFLNSDAFLFLILIILLLQLRERKVSMARLLIMPIIMTMLSIPFFYITASSGWFGFSLVIIGLLVGLMLGVFLGSLMEVKLREEDGKIVMKGSILVVLLWGIIILIKILSKNYLNENHILSLDILTSIFLAITLGTMISRRVIIYQRYRKKNKFNSQT